VTAGNFLFFMVAAGSYHDAELCYVQRFISTSEEVQLAVRASRRRLLAGQRHGTQIERAERPRHRLCKTCETKTASRPLERIRDAVLVNDDESNL
jgi:hypothetical protein